MIRESSASLHRSPQEIQRFEGLSNQYHHLGPLADLSDPRVVGSIATAIRTYEGRQVGYDHLSDNQKTDLSSMYRDAADAELIKSQSGVSNPDGSLATAEALYEKSIRAINRADAPICDLYAMEEARLMIDTLKGVDSDMSELRMRTLLELYEKISFSNAIEVGANSPDDEIPIGLIFEYAFVSAIQYYYYAKEAEGLDYGCRLSRTREDMPAQGMKSDEGVRVAHDAVVTRSGVQYHVQLKFGVAQEPYGGYDTSRICVLEEKGMNYPGLVNLVASIFKAYGGDKASSLLVQAKAEEYLGMIKHPSESVKSFSGGLLVNA